MINEAAQSLPIQKGARPVLAIRKPPASRSSQGFRGEERFSLGQKRSQPGQLEVTAFRAQRASAINRPRGQIGVNGTHLGQGSIALGVTNAGRIH